MEKVFEKTIKHFEHRVMPYERLAKGILNSEAFAFLAFCELFNIDMIIESGICNGTSTEIWAKYYRNYPNVIIHAIDKKILPETRERLSRYALHLIEGNSLQETPKLVTEFPFRRIAIFIDGPKQDTAINLGIIHLNTKQVCLIGVHDLHKSTYSKLTGARAYFDKMANNRTSFTTDTPWFVEKYGYLDNDRGKPYIGLSPKYCCEKYGGYGPTVGLLMKELPNETGSDI